MKQVQEVKRYRNLEALANANFVKVQFYKFRRG